MCGEDFLLDLEGFGFGRGHAIADQGAGGADVEGVAAGLLGGDVEDSEDAAAVVLFGEIAGN